MTPRRGNFILAPVPSALQEPAIKPFTLARSLWPLAALFACAGAHATRPMVVDDATITAPGNCQVESWTQHTTGQLEYWAVPACNLGGKWELSAGGGRIGPGGSAAAYRSGVVQAKTVFKALEDDDDDDDDDKAGGIDWAVGLTIANQFRQGTGAIGDLSVLVPFTVSLLDGKVLAHANAGWLHPRSGSRQDGFLAAGAEWSATARTTLTLEAYGSRRGHGYEQAGVRYALIPDRLALDAGVGDRIGHAGAERYYTIGLTLTAQVLR
ncbi:hypothetical protein HH212_20150 [Massilia forsythiae]|uniref:Uncharacterized protein n=1 Tax=Massilia forsythiae TaxID=2728020 RepID=A0A7Z2W042_9BURK|nr:hypothetical protein [Massilia forsythiae]QJE02047.1 hypothetical protein HH212_20150 [Massilia forsythiae]